jgi:uncharacterized membrane protein required for colicin V production
MKNLPEILSQFNWIDIFVVILTLRILYIAFRTGVKFEIFKLLGTFTGLYISLHYYTSLSDLFNSRILNSQTRSSFFDIVSFALLAFAGYGLFFLLRMLIGKITQSEVNPHLDKWGGFICGTCRAVLTVSLSLCFFMAGNGEYFKKSVHSSFSGTYVTRVAADTYTCVWNGFASKLRKEEKLNPAVKGFTQI